MSLLDGVCRLLGVHDNELEDANELEFPAAKEQAQGTAERELIAMPEPMPTTLCVARPDRDSLKGALYDIKEYKRALQNRQTVILDLTLLASIDYEGAEQLVNYLAGAADMIDGTASELTTNVFLFAPPEVKLVGNSMKTIKVQQ
jgi:FtsZ-interacting cell division protein YlmF